MTHSKSPPKNTPNLKGLSVPCERPVVFPNVFQLLYWQSIALCSTILDRQTQPHQPCLQVQFLFEVMGPSPLQSISPLPAHPHLHFDHCTLLLIIPIISVCSFGCSGEIIICLGINTLTGIFFFFFCTSSSLLASRLFLFVCFCSKRQEGLKVWSFGLLINLLLTVCPLVTFVLEKDEAAIESSEFNATSVADVDKRVKRRLLMGNSFLPLSMCCHGACACMPDSTPLPPLSFLPVPLTLFLIFFCFVFFPLTSLMPTVSTPTVQFCCNSIKCDGNEVKKIKMWLLSSFEPLILKLSV